MPKLLLFVVVYLSYTVQTYKYASTSVWKQIIFLNKQKCGIVFNVEKMKNSFNKNMYFLKINIVYQTEVLFSQIQCI